MAKGGSVYMMCSLNNSTIYTGVGSDLVVRVLQHKEKGDPQLLYCHLQLHQACVLLLL